MKKKRKSFTLTSIDYRVFITLYELEKMSLYAKPQGLVETFLGENKYEHLLAYNTLKNYSSKRLSMRLKILLRKNYLGLKYNQETDDIYYCLKESGKKEAIEYLSKHKTPFKKVINKIEDNIVFIK